MSNMSIKHGIDRIRSSEPPLAIFDSGRRDLINVVFAETIETRRLIDEGDPRFIGIFSKKSSRESIISFLASRGIA